MMHISTATDAGVTEIKEHIRKVRNPNSSLQFEIAAQAAAERELQAHVALEPVCTCHPGQIDGVEYVFINAGCRVHRPLQEHYIPRVPESLRDKIRDGKRNTAAVKGER